MEFLNCVDLSTSFQIVAPVSMVKDALEVDYTTVHELPPWVDKQHWRPSVSVLNQVGRDSAPAGYQWPPPARP